MTTARPLAGRTIVVTRAAEQSGSLVDALRERGARVVEVPTIVVTDPDDGGAALRRAIQRIDEYDWMVVTSANGADRVGAALGGRVLPGALHVAAVGPGTAARLAERGIAAALVPDEAVAEGLLAAFPTPSGRARLLLPQAAAARPVLADGLRDAGWTVDVVVAYRTVAASPGADLLRRAETADAIAFTSGSTVDGWLRVAAVTATPPLVVCIGPVTAAAARRGGLQVAAVAEPHTVPGLVDALEALWT